MNKEILNEIHYLQELINTLEKEINYKDIRLSIFDGFHAILCHYLLERKLKDNILLIETYRTIFKDPRLGTKHLQTQIQNQINGANSKLILETWSNFELFISYLTNTIFTTEKKDELCNKNYNDLIKCCKKEEIDLTGVTCVEKMKLKEFHLVASARKISSLMSNLRATFKPEEYTVNLGFLTNYNRIRNCIHSNYIFHGQKEINYEYANIKYTFRPDEPIIMSPLEEDTLFKNYIKLRELCEHIVSEVEYSNCIFDPSFLVKE